MPKLRSTISPETTQGDIHRSLEDLEADVWGDPVYDSYVVMTVHSLRRKPLGTLTDEELRLGIGQAVGLKYLVPLAVSRLRENPLLSGDFYPGALLSALMRVGKEFWHDNLPLRREVSILAATAVRELPAEEDYDENPLHDRYAAFVRDAEP